MRIELLALACVCFSGCAGEDLIVADAPAAGSGGDPDVSQLLDFEPPRVIAELESADVSDDDPSLTSDLLLLCFNSKRDGGAGEEDIWCSRRARSTDAWEAPVLQTELNTKHRETGIALSLDGLSLWFSSDRDGGSGGLDVYTATRATRDSGWSEATRVLELSSQDDDLVSSIDESAQRLMLARRTRSDDDDDYHIFLAERTTADEAWQAPNPVPELDSDAGESDAFLVGDGLRLIFTRDADLMLAVRTSSDAAFDRIEPLQALNTDMRERDAWSNSAFTYVVFSSDRAGSFRLYESSRKARD